jgi:hypothetical protein
VAALEEGVEQKADATREGDLAEALDRIRAIAANESARTPATVIARPARTKRQGEAKGPIPFLLSRPG